MIVNNKYVEIKQGKKIYRKQNMILNEYLKNIFNSQIDPEHNFSAISHCYLKLDTPIENVDYDSQLDGILDFDIFIYPTYVPTFTYNKNIVTITYKFDDSRFAYNHSLCENKGLGSFNGRKITAIGFGSNRNCFAFLDTSSMNIIINANEDFIITRVDNIQSSGIASKIEYPLHLVNDIAKRDLKNIQLSESEVVEEKTMAQLYSVGFGNTLGLMEEEYLVNDVEVDRDDTSITFNVNRIKKVGHYPSENLRLGFYPTIDNSKYLVFKYRLYRRYDRDGEPFINYLDEYYTMSMSNENFGNLNVKLKMERL